MVMVEKEADIIQIMPTDRNVSAVYYDDKTKKIFREPVICWLLFRNGVIEPAVWGPADKAVCSGITAYSNFLGLEFDGEEKDWKREIDEYLKHG